jgi:hypothetical protein
MKARMPRLAHLEKENQQQKIQGIHFVYRFSVVSLIIHKLTTNPDTSCTTATV